MVRDAATAAVIAADAAAAADAAEPPQAAPPPLPPPSVPPDNQDNPHGTACVDAHRLILSVTGALEKTLCPY